MSVDNSTKIKTDLDALQDEYNQLVTIKKEYETNYNALTTEANTDFFNTLKDCGQFNTGSLSTYDTQVTNLKTSIASILTEIGNYINNQRETDTINENEIEKIEEPSIEDGAGSGEITDTPVLDTQVDGMDTETLESGKDTEIKATVSDNNEKEVELENINNGNEIEIETTDKESTIKEEEKLEKINDGKETEVETTDKESTIKEEEKLEKINNEKETEVKTTDKESTIKAETELADISNNKETEELATTEKTTVEKEELQDVTSGGDQKIEATDGSPKLTEKTTLSEQTTYSGDAFVDDEQLTYCNELFSQIDGSLLSQIADNINSYANANGVLLDTVLSNGSYADLLKNQFLLGYDQFDDDILSQINSFSADIIQKSLRQYFINNGRL